MGQNHNHDHFVIPFKTLMNVCLWLCFYTVLTVVTAKVPVIHHALGPLAPLVAFGIAAAKAYLVMAHFMGLKYDTKSNRIIFASGFAFLGLLFIIVFIDIFTRVLQTNTL
ncbi:MAG: cytochrome C oxidase subunit IV family protein [Proteobacteria bacterium]|jgi:cytochrome c oxidase subunit 4|nr:cytochrome C oxidase subunit IV family protein [Pseudomonadota bacterium]